MKTTLKFVRDYEHLVGIWTAVPEDGDKESVQEYFNRIEAMVEAINKVDNHYHNKQQPNEDKRNQNG